MNRSLRGVSGRVMLVIGCSLVVVLGSINVCRAATARQIDVMVDFALERLKNEVKPRIDITHAKGVLVIPRVVRAGLIVGGEYGKGALRIEGKTVDYYSLAGASFGLQLGIQEKNVILVFMEEGALKKFRESNGWKAGVDGAVVVADTGVEGSVDTTTYKAPVVAFVFGQRGFMVNATLDGAKFTKLKK